MTENWKKITFNQFHDLAAGSGIAVIYKDARRDYTEVFHADHEISEGSIETLATAIDTRAKGDAPMLVFNPMGWPRSETVALSVQLADAAEGVRILDSHEEVLPSQVISSDAATHRFEVLARVRDIPPLGYSVLHAEKGKGVNVTSAVTDVKVADRADSVVLSNEHLSVAINKKNGCITSLMSTSQNGNGGVESIAAGGCGNQLQTFKDTPSNYDAWNIDPGTLDHMTPIEALDSVSVVDHGPLRARVRVTRSWQSSKFVQEISLDAGADAVMVANDVDWHETHVLLKAAFPLSASGPKATYEIPYGSIERPTTRNNSWEKAQFEVPAMRWADLGDATHGVSVLNDSKYGYDAEGNTLRITLLRSPTWPDPDADRGRQQFQYAIYPHAGGWKQSQTVRRGYELNYPMTVKQVFAHSGSLPAQHSWGAVENANVTLTAVKKAEDANALVFRMYEWAGTASEVKLHVPPGASFAVESNLMEKTEGEHLPMTGGVVTVPIKPYEILTVQVEYPTAVAAK